ncbi:MarR family winged helix-turn-helix transcriptional regulator [Sporolactobacillus vineae]|uniref:MarR family winged helix-turn-helix transcriptional regulator n=1 Tax=Sporolactobacillus vineae TaxID=444463 RepID=UPI000289D1FA|nr:MarR family transcriptional regulator [Sporolactobacillus vineae]
MKKAINEKTVDKGKKKDRQLWQTLSQTYHIQLRSFGRFLLEWNLSVSQYSVLRYVAESERISQKALAQKLLVSKGNVTQLIVKMERSGYIRREQQWKTKYISLTEKGYSVYQQLLPEQEDYFAGQFQSLTKKEEKQLIKLLHKIMPEGGGKNEKK